MTFDELFPDKRVFQRPDCTWYKEDFLALQDEFPELRHDTQFRQALQQAPYEPVLYYQDLDDYEGAILAEQESDETKWT